MKNIYKLTPGEEKYAAEMRNSTNWIKTDDSCKHILAAIKRNSVNEDDNFFVITSHWEPEEDFYTILIGTNYILQLEVSRIENPNKVVVENIMELSVYLRESSSYRRKSINKLLFLGIKLNKMIQGTQNL
jgi:hypothetical protein